jgi:hypothetical protein
MRDRPTYWEYRFANQDGYIRTRDGWFFKTHVSKAAKWVPFGLTMLLLVLFAGVYLLSISGNLSYSRLNSRLFDFLTFPLLISAICKPLEYRMTGYHLIEENSEDIETAKGIVFARNGYLKAAFLLAIPIWTFAALNSNAAILLYSAIADRPAIIEATADMPGQQDVPILNTQTISLQSGVTDATLEIIVTRAVYRASFYLDGEECLAYDDVSDFSLHFFWEEYYPRNEYKVLLFDIKDGSVLTMDCGDIHREWTFRAID